MEVERTVQFILQVQAEMQAKHAAWMEDMEARVKEHADHLRRIDANLATATDLIGRLAKAELLLAEDDRKQRQAVEQQRQSIEQQRQAVEQQRLRSAEIDERLNTLIDIVDKLVRRNGHTH